MKKKLQIQKKLKKTKNRKRKTDKILKLKSCEIIPHLLKFIKDIVNVLKSRIVLRNILGKY